MKRVYFVRHGQSVANATGVIDSDPSPLTDKGRKQAEQIAARVTTLQIQKIISSPFPRAHDTAVTISRHINLPVEKSDLFIERRRPTRQIGLHIDSPENRKIEEEIIHNFAVPGYRYEDGENFDDLKLRAGRALAFLSTRSEEVILVATHGTFLRVLLSYAVFGDKLTGDVCSRCMGSFRTENTALFIFDWEAENSNPWTVFAWNDHAHLAE